MNPVQCPVQVSGWNGAAPSTCIEHIHYTHLYNLHSWIGSGILLVFTQQSYCLGPGIRRPSVNSVFSETIARIQAKCYGNRERKGVSATERENREA